MNDASDSSNGISVEKLVKFFGTNRVLDQVSLFIAPGEFLAVLGPSGCGKTTLLRVIAGLLAPDDGRVDIGGETMVDAARDLFVPAEHRRLGMVFQDYALWPHMRVRENVAFPLESRKLPAADKVHLVGAALRRVGLGALAERFPAELSGGQQQRVALARAIAGSPRVLLFDEPLSNLDTALRDALGHEIGRLTRELGLTALYITHDQSEALSLADRVAVMRQGRIVQIDTPERIYREPADAWVANFLRAGRLLPGTVTERGFTPSGSSARIALPDANGHRGAAQLLVPADAVRLCTAAPDAEIIVSANRFKGERYEIVGHLPDGDPAHTIRFWNDRPIADATRLPVSLDFRLLRLYPGDPVS